MVTAGIFVKMAIPKNTPEKRIKMFFLSLDTDFRETAHNIEDRIKGSCIDSNQMVLRSSENGNTANRMEAINATVLLYLR
jgi:hypothetical protein